MADSAALESRRRRSRSARGTSDGEPQPPPTGAALLRFLRSLPAITPEGQVLAFLLMSASTYLVISGHLLLYLALAIGLAMLAVGFVYPYLNMRRLSVRRDLPESAFAGEPVFVELAVANRRARLPAFAVAVVDDAAATDGDPEVLHLPVIAAGEAGRVGYYTRFPRRGTYRLRYVRLASSFPFLLFSRGMQLRCTNEIVVYPRPGQLRRRVLPEPRGAFTASPQRQRGGDQFHGLREYRIGEDARRIHWKSSLRRGRGMPPLVREFEIEGGDEVLVALDPALDGSPEHIIGQERAISFAITLSRQLWRRGYRVHFGCFGEDRPFQATLSVDPRGEWRRMLDHLAHYVGKGTHTLEALIARMRLGERPRVALVVVTGRDGLDEEGIRRLWSGGGQVTRIDVESPAIEALFAETQGRVLF